MDDSTQESHIRSDNKDSFLFLDVVVVVDGGGSVRSDEFMDFLWVFLMNVKFKMMKNSKVEDEERKKIISFCWYATNKIILLPSGGSRCQPSSSLLLGCTNADNGKEVERNEILKSKEELQREHAWGWWLGAKLKLGIGLLKL
ncbi:hypothetical protein MTR_6g452820 [Medicago truncatula]|uniref:Uncharacterized protein n=1 Tax=Medicago truncatula TaxID=3880 RepID=A0A072U9I4_MEDTR|nr:hypothetical protein MTR_6g452820 [Medicago truncatula]